MSAVPSSGVMPQLWSRFSVALSYREDTTISGSATVTHMQHAKDMVETSLSAITNYANAARDGGELTPTAVNLIPETVADK